jgi:hypothetical protein
VTQTKIDPKSKLPEPGGLGTFTGGVYIQYQGKDAKDAANIKWIQTVGVYLVQIYKDQKGKVQPDSFITGGQPLAILNPQIPITKNSSKGNENYVVDAPLGSLFYPAAQVNVPTPGVSWMFDKPTAPKGYLTEDPAKKSVQALFDAAKAAGKKNVNTLCANIVTLAYYAVAVRVNDLRPVGYVQWIGYCSQQNLGMKLNNYILDGEIHYFAYLPKAGTPPKEVMAAMQTRAVLLGVTIAGLGPSFGGGWR